MPEVVTLLENIPEAKLEGLLASLESAEFTMIKPKCRPSRSGATLFCDGFEALLRTNKHEHELDCTMIETSQGLYMTCSWKVDGKEIAVLQFRPDEDIVKRVKEIVGTIARVLRVGSEPLPPLSTQEIELSPRPSVVWVPKETITPP